MERRNARPEGCGPAELYAVWKTDRPFDGAHCPWENPGAAPLSTTTPGDPDAGATPAGNDKAVGHKRDMPAKQVVTTAKSTVEPTASPVKTATPPRSATRRR